MKRNSFHVLSIAFVLVALSASAAAQAPDILWSRTYGDNAAVRSLHELPDSGFIMGGYVTPDGDAYQDMYLVRTNADGDTLWTNTIGQSGRHEDAKDLSPTRDGGFILVGNRGEDAPYTSSSDVYLVKTDSNGDREWHSLFGSDNQSESGVSVVEAVGGGYFLAGYFWDATTVYDIWLLLTTELGILTSPQHMTWGDADYPTSLCLTAGPGFALTGYSQSFDAEYDYDMFIHKMNGTGTGAWSQAYGAGHPVDEAANHICQTSDGGYLLCGYRRTDTDPKDVYVVKTDSSGGTEWTSQVGGTYHDEARCCIETIDGGYAVAASWYVDGQWKVGLIKYNNAGDTLWTAVWGEEGHSYTPYGLVQTADNGYAIAGLRSGGQTAAFLVKFEPDPGIDPYTSLVADLGIPINDTSPAADTITFSIPGEKLEGRTVYGIRVLIDSLDHPAIDDLTLTLTHEGTTVPLVNQGDAAGSGFSGTVFTDAATAILGSGQTPYTGVFRPAGRLNDFIDVDPNGNWILTITDGAAGNDGLLQGWGITLLTDVALDTEDDSSGPIPLNYSLSHCYPNPFNPTTTIDYNIPRQSHVIIEIYNLLGQRVATLIDETKPAGDYKVMWDGTDSGGASMASGIYLYRLQAGDFSETKQMVLLK